MLYQHWFAGDKNVVADSLSRDCYFMNERTHKTFLKITCPSQLPSNFHIKQIPKEVSYFITSTLEQLPVIKERLIPQKPSELAHGKTGILLSLASESQVFSSSTDYQDSKRTLSSQHLPKQSEKQLSHQEIVNIWWKQQSIPPYHM